MINLGQNSKRRLDLVGNDLIERICKLKILIEKKFSIVSFFNITQKVRNILKIFPLILLCFSKAGKRTGSFGPSQWIKDSSSAPKNSLCKEASQKVFIRPPDQWNLPIPIHERKTYPTKSYPYSSFLFFFFGKSCPYS